jgi:UTP--glucose-1-phosphate uridylyltransferase
MSVETAVIPVAGAGTRVFPSTTAIEKCMMPVYAGEHSRPVIDFMVDDCALAGIKRVIFVTSERGQAQLQDYFESINPALEAQLRGLGRHDRLAEELERRRHFGLTYEYVLQPSDRYGTACPPALAQDHLRGEKVFALMGGDDFVYRQDGGSELADAITSWNKFGTDHVIMGNPVARTEGPRYGILLINDEDLLTGIDEKPPITRVPDKPIANISRYLLSEAIWPQIEAEMATVREKGEEHFITHPINDALANGQTFKVHRIEGKYLEGGSFEGLQEASLYVAAHPKATLGIN